MNAKPEESTMRTAPGKPAPRALERWIEDTQMFQRIAGVNVSSKEDLTREWENMKNKTRRFAVDNIREHRIIQDMAVRAAKGRRS